MMIMMMVQVRYKEKVPFKTRESSSYSKYFTATELLIIYISKERGGFLSM